MKVDCWACYNNINEEDRYKAHNLEKKSLMDVSGHSPFINNYYILYTSPTVNLHNLDYKNDKGRNLATIFLENSMCYLP